MLGSRALDVSALVLVAHDVALYSAPISREADRVSLLILLEHVLSIFSWELVPGEPFPRSGHSSLHSVDTELLALLTLSLHAVWLILNGSFLHLPQSP